MKKILTYYFNNKMNEKNMACFFKATFIASLKRNVYIPPKKYTCR